MGLTNCVLIFVMGPPQKIKNKNPNKQKPFCCKSIKEDMEILTNFFIHFLIIFFFIFAVGFPKQSPFFGYKGKEDMGIPNFFFSLENNNK